MPDSEIEIPRIKFSSVGTSLPVQWLRLRASTAGVVGLIPGQGTKILQAVQYGQKKKISSVSNQLCDFFSNLLNFCSPQFLHL